MPIVDVLVPTHNRSVMLRQCLDSIRSQTLQDIVVTIGDDCSDDGTPEVAREYCAVDSRFRYVRNVKNLGQWGNVNSLLRQVSAPYVHILHDDDWIEPGFYAELVPVLDSSPSVGLAFCRSVVSQTGHEYPPTLPANWPVGEVLPRHRAFQWMLKGDFVPVGSVLMRAAALHDIVPLPEQFESVDWLLWLELAVASDVGLVDVPLAHYRVHGAQMSTDRLRLYKDILKMLTSARDLPVLRDHYSELTEARFEACRSYVLALKESPSARRDILDLSSSFSQLDSDHRTEMRRIVNLALAYAALPPWLKYGVIAKGSRFRRATKRLLGFGTSRGPDV